MADTPYDDFDLFEDDDMTGYHIPRAAETIPDVCSHQTRIYENPPYGSEVKWRCTTCHCEGLDTESVQYIYTFEAIKAILKH